MSSSDSSEEEKEEKEKVGLIAQIKVNLKDKGWWSRNWWWVVIASYLMTRFVLSALGVLLMFIINYALGYFSLLGLPITIIQILVFVVQLLTFVVPKLGNRRFWVYLGIILAIVFNSASAWNYYEDAKFLSNCTKTPLLLDVACIWQGSGLNIANMLFAILQVIMVISDLAMIIFCAVKGLFKEIKKHDKKKKTKKEKKQQVIMVEQPPQVPMYSNIMQQPFVTYMNPVSPETKKQGKENKDPEVPKEDDEA